MINNFQRFHTQFTGSQGNIFSRIIEAAAEFQGRREFCIKKTDPFRGSHMLKRGNEKIKLTYLIINRELLKKFKKLCPRITTDISFEMLRDRSYSFFVIIKFAE